MPLWRAPLFAAAEPRFRAIGARLSPSNPAMGETEGVVLYPGKSCFVERLFSWEASDIPIGGL